MHICTNPDVLEVLHCTLQINKATLMGKTVLFGALNN